jgi:hypothetical protein
MKAIGIIDPGESATKTLLKGRYTRSFSFVRTFVFFGESLQKSGLIMHEALAICNVLDILQLFLWLCIMIVVQYT